ncbi:MAG: HYR domain-containing protein [Lewinellaceae bacterium]|nr:HYR domain-containing protein [Lewinellaceae bacterium]
MNKFYIPLFAVLFLAQTLAAQTDTEPPHLQCTDMVNVNLTLPCVTVVWANDLVDSLHDNAPGSIELGIRKRCTGTGFPEGRTHIQYNVNEMGLNHVEVWAKDAAGNTALCTVRLLVGNLAQNCDPSVSVSVNHPTGAGISGVGFALSGYNCVGDTIPFPNLASTITTGGTGYWGTFGQLLEPGYTSLLTPSKTTNPLNGVTTADLAAIQRHILGLEPFDAPWKIIAADANLDGKVTLQDVVLLQKLLLGHILKMPHGKSWRFFPKNYVFPNPNNPLQPPLPGAIATPNTADPAPNWFDFTGVKIGDVNASADPGL